ncbi:MAG: hypothetical protein ACRYG5_11940 [Janthinobacterium lividum]
MMNLAELKQLIRHLEHAGIQSLAVDAPGFRLRVVADWGARPACVELRDDAAGAAPELPPPAPAADETRETAAVILTSPFIGLFMAAHPTRPGMGVEAGYRAAAHEVLGLVSVAGGILRPLRAPCAGTVVERSVASGERVEFGSQVFVLRAHAEVAS